MPASSRMPVTSATAVSLARCSAGSRAAYAVSARSCATSARDGRGDAVSPSGRLGVTM